MSSLTAAPPAAGGRECKNTRLTPSGRNKEQNDIQLTLLRLLDPVRPGLEPVQVVQFGDGGSPYNCGGTDSPPNLQGQTGKTLLLLKLKRLLKTRSPFHLLNALDMFLSVKIDVKECT